MRPTRSFHGPSTTYYGKALIILFLVYCFKLLSHTSSNNGYKITNVYSWHNARSSSASDVVAPETRDLRDVPVPVRGNVHKRMDPFDSDSDDGEDSFWYAISDQNLGLQF